MRRLVFAVLIVLSLGAPAGAQGGAYWTGISPDNQVLYLSNGNYAISNNSAGDGWSKLRTARGPFIMDVSLNGFVIIRSTTSDLVLTGRIPPPANIMAP
jgi:hypothetical protein